MVNFSVIHFFFALLVSCLGWVHLQCDVKNAYLCTLLNEAIYMKQPPGFESNGTFVCKLNKALYGLHQSSRMWFFEIHNVLLELGFV